MTSVRRQLWARLLLLTLTGMLASPGLFAAVIETPPESTDPWRVLPHLSISGQSSTVSLSWTPQTSATGILAGNAWASDGRLLGTVTALDKDFVALQDSGNTGATVRFDVPKNAAAAFFLPQAMPASPANGGLRLDGTFIQYQNWMTNLNATSWNKELEAMDRARIRLIFLQWHEYNQSTFLPASDAGNDATEIILSFADQHGWQVFLGLAMNDAWWNQATDTAYLQKTAASSRDLATRIWSRYRRHPSFAGWYVPQETWDGGYTDAQISALRSFYRQVSDQCKQLSGGRPVAISPFFSGGATPEKTEQNYSKLLEGAGLDILLLQDGVGARGWDAQVAERVTPYFRAFRNACLTAGVAFWSDLESFRLVSADPLSYAPAPVERLRQQLLAEAPFVQRFVTFDFFHYLSPARGTPQAQLYADYLSNCVDRPFFPQFGRSVEVDPQYPYYRERSPQSVASEIRANGYSIVRYVVTADSTIRDDLLEAFHREGLGVWYSTFANGVYTNRDLPTNWPSWQMVTRSHLQGQPLDDGFTRLCLNNPAYRAWKKTQITRVLRQHSFDGIDLMEPFWPEYPGPSSPAYACFCSNCLASFRTLYPGETALPDILNPSSPLSPANNPALWTKWLEFRHRSVTAFLNDLVNGKEGLRASTPQTPVCVWTLALTETNGVQKMLEYHGLDLGEMVATVRPDMVCLQTHWPDWIRADLKPDYVLNYVPFIQAIRSAIPKLPILIQADTGSQKQNRRSWSWIREFERYSEKAGAQNTTLYEYFIGNYVYTDPPKVVSLRLAGGEIELRFSKRLDPSTASDVSRYQLSDGQVRSSRVDGNRVFLTTIGIQEPARTTLTVRGVSDAASLRFFPDRPATTLLQQTIRLR